jgi:hypothetical protein
MKVQEALKAAIEAMEIEGIGGSDAAQLCKSALSEIEKCEPVGEIYNKDKKYILLNNSDKEYPHGTLLYTSPISKEWVGLTYKDKVDLRENTDWYNFPNDLIEATEAKLKQLNAPEKG